VGKTSLIHHLARLAHCGAGPQPLRGKRLLQFSIRSRAAALKKPEDLRPAFQELVSALIERPGTIVPFLRDIHVAYFYDCEPQLERLALRFDGVILDEADVTTLDMLRYAEELEQHRSSGRRLSGDALETALELSHRFLSRSHMPRKAIDVLEQVQATAGGGEGATS
jgi:ATP-dependent Clp protease ATP-binding subunit ClpA